jgi:hypothetical protein
MHGNTAIVPLPYEAWIEHMVQRGNIVIYPRYQTGLLEIFFSYESDALFAIKAALTILGPSADTTRFAWAGHSLGGILQFSLAAKAVGAGLPVAKAIFAAHPGPFAVINGSIFDEISPDTMVLILVGDDDNIVADTTGIKIMAALPQIRWKNLLEVHSDAHGSPPLVAGHFAPLSPPTDALDYYAYWRLSDALFDFAFYGIEGDIALGGGDNQISMGQWSDGVPVIPLSVRPVISLPGILNAASLQPGPIALGEVVLVTGTGLGSRQVQPFQIDPESRLSNALSGTRVLFQGIASPLVYSYMNQVAAVVPYGIRGTDSVSVHVEAGSYTSGTSRLESRRLFLEFLRSVGRAQDRA